ncbi:MAG: phage integrase SAM-like domain-containing protein [Muribaculaceae bacterium]|nr:phage integrase SAM-like domain-containing protein [Muribaculaceae bacterium]
MATVYFSLSSKLIGGKKQVMVRFGGTGFNQRAKSGFYVNPTYWDNSLQSIIVPKPRLFTDAIIETIKELREVDAKLRDLRIRIEDAYTAAPTAPLYDKKWLKHIIEGDDSTVPEVDDLDFFSAWDAFIRLRQVGKKRKEMFAVVRNILLRFEAVMRMKNDKFSLSLTNFSPVLLAEFENFLWEEEKYVNRYPQIYKGVRDVRRGQNTISCRLKVFRTFYNWAVSNNLAQDSPFAKFKIHREFTYLTLIVYALHKSCYFIPKRSITIIYFYLFSKFIFSFKGTTKCNLIFLFRIFSQIAQIIRYLAKILTCKYCNWLVINIRYPNCIF